MTPYWTGVPSHMQAIARDAMGKKGERSGRMVPCEVCGKECYCQPSGNRKHCSNACRLIALRMGNVIASSTNVHHTGKACRCCGKEILRVRTRRPNGKWNSPRCGKDKQEFCNKACARLHHANGSREAYIAKVVADLFCDIVRHVLDPSAPSLAGLGRTHKERAIKRGAKYEHIRRSDVFNRDGWRCQLCGCKVNRKALRSRDTGRLHPRNAHMDHIVPLAAGGSHTMDNVQCACLRCNVRKWKHNRGQMRLF